MSVFTPDVQSWMRWAMRRQGRLLLFAALAAALYFGGRGITDESAVSLQGDMPRYLMNGVFLRDFAGSPDAFSVEGGISFARRYFAQYPALSLGHHPPLLPIALVPFYAVFGVSVFAGRLAILTFFLLSVCFLYGVTRQRFDDPSAGWASLLFATNPLIVTFGQGVLSEIPMVTLVLAAMFFLGRFRDGGQVRDFLLFGVAAIASLISKQLAIFMFPFYAVMLVFGGGTARLFRRDVMVWTAAGAAVIVPVGLFTLALSPFNVALVAQVFRDSAGLSEMGGVLRPIFDTQLKPSLWLVLIVGVAIEAIVRERRIVQFLFWIVTIIGGVVLVTGPFDSARYSLVAVPAYCICAASLSKRLGVTVRRVLMFVLLGAVGAQAWKSYGVLPVGAAGYEPAARYVVREGGAPTVLYSASVDSGYFVFFVRKHDSDRRLVVLRSDKLLTTSLMDKLSFGAQIKSSEEIYPLLDRLGTRFVVIEDRPSGSEVLDWLRLEVQGARFIERQRTPTASRDRRLRGVDVVVYEYRDAKPASPDAAIEISLPLVGRDIRVPLSDIQRGRTP